MANAKKRKFTNTYLNSYDDLLALLLDGDRAQAERLVNPTQKAFIYDSARVTAYMGPAGVAKTSTIVAKVFMHALLTPGTKYLIARADYNDLADTTMLRAEQMLRYLPEGTLLDRSGKPPEKWWIKPASGATEEDPDPSQITFMGLKDTMGSYEFNGAIIDEAAEVDELLVHEVNTRLRHNKGAKFLSLAFNPPNETHWLYTACTGKDAKGEFVREPWMKLYTPQAKENNRNLPENYHELLAATLPEQMRQRLIEGIWGNTFPGDPVLGVFKHQMHLRIGLKYAGGTIFRFWDFGFRRPACLWVQVTLDGRVQILREVLGHNMTGEAFIALVKKMTAEHFPNARTFADYGDPAVAQKKDTGQMAALMMQAGIVIKYQHTPFDVSLNVLRKKFETLIAGEPAIVIDKAQCPNLVGGLAGGYHFKRDGVTPHKDEFFDHLVDALRYGIWNLFGVSNTTSTSIPMSVAYWDNHGNN